MSGGMSSGGLSSGSSAAGAGGGSSGPGGGQGGLSPVVAAPVNGGIGRVGLAGTAGITKPEADAWYVNVEGDTMTGALAIPAGTVGGLPLAVSPAAGNTLEWDASGWYVPAVAGEPGPVGPPGPPGAEGATGATGPAGVGVPVGGATGEVLTKTSATDYATAWQAPTGGGGAAEVTITGTEGVTVVESPANTFALGLTASPDANNTVEVRANGIYSAAGAIPPEYATDAEVAAALSAHAGAADPHPVYLTAAEGDAAYLPLSARSHDHTAADGSGALSNEEHDGYSQYANLGADPAQPGADRIRLYSKDNGSGIATLYYRTEDGTIYELPTFTSGGGGGGSGAPANATYITTAGETRLSGERVLGTAVIMSGVLTGRPAAGTAGRLYLATDTDLVYRDTGSTWETFATRAAGGGGGAVTSVDGQTGAVDLSATYLNVTGDTATGTLILQGASSGATVLQGKISGDATQRLRLQAGGRMEWTTASTGAVVAALEQTGTSTLQVTGNLSPAVTASQNMGLTSNRWDTLYAGGVDVTGTLAGADATFLRLGTTNAPNAGAVRLRNGTNGQLAWRNAAAGGNLTLTADASDRLAYSGTTLQLGGDATLTRSGAGLLQVGSALHAPAGTFDVKTGTAPGTTRLQVGQNGTVTVTPDAGQPSLSAGAGTNLHLTSSGGNSVTVNSGSTYVHPNVDNTHYLGHPSFRFYGAFITAGVTTGSSAEAKETITPLPPEDALAAVRATDPVVFDYRPPERSPEWYELPDDPEQAAQVLEQRMTAAPLEAGARHQAGFVLRDETGTYATDPLFETGEGQSNAANSAGILLAAIKALDARLVALEGV